MEYNIKNIFDITYCPNLPLPFCFGLLNAVKQNETAGVQLPPTDSFCIRPKKSQSDFRDLIPEMLRISRDKSESKRWGSLKTGGRDANNRHC